MLIENEQDKLEWTLSFNSLHGSGTQISYLKIIHKCIIIKYQIADEIFDSKAAFSNKQRKNRKGTWLFINFVQTENKQIYVFENMSIKYFNADIGTIPNVTHVIQDKLSGALLFMQEN